VDVEVTPSLDYWRPQRW